MQITLRNNFEKLQKSSPRVHEMGQLQPRANTQTWCKWRENAKQERRTGRVMI